MTRSSKRTGMCIRVHTGLHVATVNLGYRNSTVVKYKHELLLHGTQNLMTQPDPEDVFVF